MTDEEFDMTVDQNFTTVLSDGTEVILCPDGENRKVRKGGIDEFIELVLQARFNECKQ